MAEPQKGASSSAKAKEKTSLLDLDIGKDFLSSWKSMSVAEDMDFDFGTVAKGKKKIFNFDKMDMDFNLDGDFDKISSFKVDMSDLDISSDPKELENPRKKSKEVSAGENDQGKTDRFAFKFDFNKLDSISFESTLMEEDKKSNKNKDREGSLNKSGCQGSEIHLSEDVGALEEDINLKLPASQGVISSKGDAQVGGVGDLDSTNGDCTSKSVAHDNCSSKSANFVDQVAIQGARFSPQKTTSTCTQESDQESHQPAKTTSPESYAQDLSVQSISRNASPRDTNSELQEEVSTSATELSTSTGGEQNANVKVIADSGSNYEKSMLENLPTQHMVSSQSNNSERKKFGGDNHAPIGDKDGAESAEGDLQFEYTSITNVSRELVHDTPSNGENQVSHAKPLVAPLNSGATVDKLMLGNERETGVIRSKYFKRSDETESQLQQGSFSQKNLSSFGTKRIGTVQLSPADERRECDAKDPHSGSKLAGISWPKPRELPRGKLVQAGSREIVKSLNSTGEGFNADGTETGSKLIATSRPHVEDVTKGGIVLGGSVKNNKALNTLSSHVHPSSLSEQTNKSTTQNVNPRLPVSSMTSSQNIKKFCVERNIISPLHAGKKTPDLSSLRISRTTGANHDPLISRSQKDSKSLRISEQNMELQRNTESKMTHYADKEKQTSLSPILKRKTFEEPNADMLTLNPSKRLSESPSESRNSRDPSERVFTKQVCNHENLTDGNNRNAFIDYQIPALGIPREINMTQLEAPLAMENVSNVEKAEACTKELEDICNMLKKKHEEAKEILVRAIVNNNNLLMLNHPIYEEKIYMIQKFAASLMSKELFT